MSDRETPPEPLRSLVVTGSSAGGIEALSGLVAKLPAAFPAPIVIAQHLDPNSQSRLPQILAQRSALPVEAATSQTVLRPGVVFVAPPGADVEVSDGRLRVEANGSGRHARPSVDRLFSSAAEAYGEHTIAIILSGMGSDGVAGAREVKRHGGTVIIQDPATAEYPSMPRSLAPNLVDVVANVADMGSLLGDLLLKPVVSDDGVEQAGLRAFLTQVRDRSGIDFLQYKMPTIRRRLARLMAAARVETFEDYSRYLQRDPDAYQRLISAFLIKVTEFMRDPPLFEYLNATLLPELIERARARREDLRLWSAGCATGEEAYSLAIAVAELLRRGGDEVDVRIFATDLDEDAIAFARRAAYPRAALKGMKKELLERYFSPTDDAYEVGKRVRNMTIFGQHDLGQRAPFPRIDLVLCRNVLIYFTKELQERALQGFGFAIRDGGYLVLGKAEATNPAPQYFTPAEPNLKIFRRRGERVYMPASRIRDSLALGGTANRPQGLLSTAPRAGDGRPNLNEVIGKLVFASSIGVILVDRHYDILSINTTARNLLNIHGVGIGEDLIHLASETKGQDLREAVDAALRNETDDLGRELVLEAPAGESERYLQVICYPERIGDGAARTEAVLILLYDVSTVRRRALEVDAEAVRLRAEVALSKQRFEEMTRRHQALIEANDELTSTNVELRSANDQLLITSEEAAAATEEIETLNEEMQATNEELETLNEELQATVEELNTTNDELEARSRELEVEIKARERDLAAAKTELTRGSAGPART